MILLSSSYLGFVSLLVVMRWVLSCCRGGGVDSWVRSSCVVVVGVVLLGVLDGQKWGFKKSEKWSSGMGVLQN